uniref:Uncharacterized protein n=1 Tax=Timema monikensis TaxID=170555 RepID=A0A7R9E4M6_9NEOP|nr:unnamed protein product [Timema monikensis]
MLAGKNNTKQDFLRHVDYISDSFKDMSIYVKAQDGIQQTYSSAFTRSSLFDRYPRPRGKHIHTQLTEHPVPVQQPRHPERERENIGDDQLRDKKAATGCEPRDGGRGDKQRYPSPVNSSDGRVYGGRRDAARAPRDPNGARPVQARRQLSGCSEPMHKHTYAPLSLVIAKYLIGSDQPTVLKGPHDTTAGGGSETCEGEAGGTRHAEGGEKVTAGNPRPSWAQG